MANDNKKAEIRQQRGGPGFRRPGMMPTEKAKDFRGAYKYLFKYLGAEKAVIIFAIVIAIIASLMGIIAPRVLGGATDEIFIGLQIGNINFNRVGQIMIYMLILHGVNIVFNYFQGFIMVGVSARITYKLRNDISGKIHTLPLKYFDKTPYGDVLSRITNDVDTLLNTLNSGMGQLITSIVTVIGIITMMLTINPVLTAVALITLPISAVCVGAIVKYSQKYFKIQQETMGKLNGHIEEMFTNHAIVKAFNEEENSIKTFGEYNDKLYEAGWRATFLSGLMMPIINIISNIGYVAIVILGGIFALAGRITIGNIQAFMQYTRQLGNPVATLTGVVSTLQSTAAAAERVFTFLDEEEESPEHTPAIVNNNVKGFIEFENVNFGYESDKPVINNFTATIKPGQKIAIVGQTGAGKTTIVKLLMRFYDVQNGAISVDGTDIRHYSREGLRSHFGMVLQDTWLFSGSIADNIRYGKLDSSDEDVKKAARAAQAHHFIRALPDSYNMQINEEADNISSGQKQLLTIARTILSDPDILILDEATSNVDTRTEVLIQRAMDTLMKGRTSFIIAHRLSTIRSADLILVMKSGDIVEQGSHEELIAQNGVYTKLYNSQFDVIEA